MKKKNPKFIKNDKARNLIELILKVTITLYLNQFKGF